MNDGRFGPPKLAALSMVRKLLRDRLVVLMVLQTKESRDMFWQVGRST